MIKISLFIFANTYKICYNYFTKYYLIYGRRRRMNLKNPYERAELEIVALVPSDIVTNSTLSNDGEKNYDDGGWV